MNDLQGNSPAQLTLSPAFQRAAPGWAVPKTRNYPPPFSLRLSESERARLEELAGSRPLGAYIRERLFGETDTRRKFRRPNVDQQTLAQVLAELGRSRLAANLNQIARACNAGVLNASPELITELQDACIAIRAMRDMLIVALGIKPAGR